MSEAISATEDALDAFVRRRREELQLTPDGLSKVFYESVSRIRMNRDRPPIQFASAKTALNAALSGRGMNMINCEALATTLRCEVGEIKRRAARRGRFRLSGGDEEVLTNQASIARDSIRSYGSWHDSEISELISNAKTQIVFVDTWFDEGYYYRPLLAGRSKKTTGQVISVNIYLLSNIYFGGRRISEIRSLSPAQFAERSEHLQNEYKMAFISGNNEAKMYLQDRSINLNLFKYDLMPGLRLLVIDDETYIFSWFPVGSFSAENACFCVSTASSSEGDQRAIVSLRQQLETIKLHSTPISDQ